MTNDDPVAPLDAYVTAKSGEPTFTLQGGDPLAAPLVNFWAQLARLRAGVIPRSELAECYATNCVAAAVENSVADNEREAENLAVRATAAEVVSWDMAAYLKGHPETSSLTEGPAISKLDEPLRLDLHDIRVRGAGALNNAVYEIDTLVDKLAEFGYNEDKVQWQLRKLAVELEMLANDVEPRKMMKRDKQAILSRRK